MPKPNCKCSRCEKEIYKKPSQLEKDLRHFCSRKCHIATIQQESGTHKEFPCNECGKKVTRTKNQRRSSKTGLCFCGNDCKNRYIARNSRWSGDPYSHRSRRPKLLDAANESCQKCGYGDFAELLDVHHDDGNHQNNKWENLRILCVRCHQEHHRLCKEIDIPILVEDQ